MPNFTETKKIQAAQREWFKNQFEDWRLPHAATLSLKQRIYNGDVGYFGPLITRDDAEKNFHHFINRLNRSIFGNTAVRFGRSVSVIPVIEGTKTKRLHYHALIDCPRIELSTTFPALVQTLWQKTLWGYRQVKVERCKDNGFIDYMTKLKDKPHYEEAIDWMNCRLSTLY